MVKIKNGGKNVLRVFLLLALTTPSVNININISVTEMRIYDSYKYAVLDF